MKLILIIVFKIIFLKDVYLQPPRQQQPQNSNQPSQQPVQQQPAPNRTPQRQQPSTTGGNSQRPRQTRPSTLCDTVCYCDRSQANCRQKQLRTIPPGPWRMGLTTLLFDQNLITSVPQGTFGQPELQRAEMLSLSYNELTELQTNGFQGLPELQEIVLSFNRIHTIQSGAFSGLNKLENINLKKNKIKTLDDAPFARNAYLRQIYIDGNLLETISSNFFENVKTLTAMSLGDNKWECNCDLMGLFMWVKSGKQLQGTLPVCSSPREQKGLSIQAFTFQDFQNLCRSEWEEELNATDTVIPEEIQFTDQINKTCSENYTSTEPVHVCYISPDIDTVPGTTICLDCIGMRDDRLLNKTENILGSDMPSYEVNITWSFPETFLNLTYDNRLIYHSNGTLCVDSIQVKDGGHYTCTAEANNVTSSKVINVSVANIPVKLAIGVVICLFLTILIVAIIFLRWWKSEVKAM